MKLIKQLNEMTNSGETETGTWKVEGDKLIVTHFDDTRTYVLTAEELLAGEKDWESGLEVFVDASEANIIWGGEIEFIIPASVYKSFTRGGESFTQRDEEDEDDTRRMRQTDWRDRNRSTFDPKR